MNKLECKRCGHKWVRRTTEPAQCPKCKSYKWKEAKQKRES